VELQQTSWKQESRKICGASRFSCGSRQWMVFKGSKILHGRIIEHTSLQWRYFGLTCVTYLEPKLGSFGRIRISKHTFACGEAFFTYSRTQSIPLSGLSGVLLPITIHSKGWWPVIGSRRYDPRKSTRRYVLDLELGRSRVNFFFFNFARILPKHTFQ
jgi:hypothetical protein